MCWKYCKQQRRKTKKKIDEKYTKQSTTITIWKTFKTLKKKREKRQMHREYQTTNDSGISNWWLVNTKLNIFIIQ